MGRDLCQSCDVYHNVVDRITRELRQALTRTPAVNADQLLDAGEVGLGQVFGMQVFEEARDGCKVELFGGRRQLLEIARELRHQILIQIGGILSLDRDSVVFEHI